MTTIVRESESTGAFRSGAGLLKLAPSRTIFQVIDQKRVRGFHQGIQTPRNG